MAKKVAVFFHNYYANHHYWFDLFLERFNFPFSLYYNIVGDSVYNFKEKNELPSCVKKAGNFAAVKSATIRVSTNQGKDIGGKLVLLDAYQRLGHDSEIGLFFHDKKSPYKTNGQGWGEKLTKITEPWFTRRVFNIFKDEPDAGVVAISGSVLDEGTAASFATKDRSILPALLGRYNLRPSSYQYVAGTIFWFRMDAMISFFQVNRPMTIRQSLEKGNIIDEYAESHTHSWERLLTWIVTTKGCKIKTIPDA